MVTFHREVWRKCGEVGSTFNYFDVELSNSERKFKNSKNFPKPGSRKTSPLPGSKGKFFREVFEKNLPSFQNINIYKKLIKNEYEKSNNIIW